MLGRPRRRLTGNEPAMGCNADSALNRNLVDRPTSSVRRYIVGKYRMKGWLAPAMVVEGMQVEDITELVSLVLSLIISWTFRPMRKTNTLIF